MTTHIFDVEVTITPEVVQWLQKFRDSTIPLGNPLANISDVQIIAKMIELLTTQSPEQVREMIGIGLMNVGAEWGLLVVHLLEAIESSEVVASIDSASLMPPNDTEQ